MKTSKKINKVKVGITIFLIVLILAIAVFGRYIYNSAREAYFTSKQFFFTSNILKLGGTNYQYNDWNGIDTYTIGIELYSFNNKLSRIDYDLEYTLTCESLSDKIQCSINTEDGGTTTTGIIYATTNGTPNNTSKEFILIKPLVELSKGEEVKLKVTAKTEEPFEKELSCNFTLKIKTDNAVSYTIEDIENRDYALLKLVNTNDTDTEITLKFDPTKVRLDLNNSIYQNKISIATDGNGYVKQIVFSMLKESSKNVKFYKVDKAQNYSYPGNTETSIIEVTT